jgi:hypothetical protein
MRKVVVGGTLARWQRLALVLGVLVAAWGPAHAAEVSAIDHSVGGFAHSHTAGSEGAVVAVPDGREILRAPDRESGGHDDPRCGHRDVERDATQATSMRLAQPEVMSGLQADVPAGWESRPALADLGGLRAPPGQVRLVMVCVWRQ